MHIWLIRAHIVSFVKKNKTERMREMLILTGR